MKLEKEIVQPVFENEYHKAAINLFYTNNWLITHQTKLFKPYDISPQQFNILRILRGQHPAPANLKLIKERMLDKMPDVSRLVERMRIKGLVERKLSSYDRRNIDVFITNKGLTLLKELDLLNKEVTDKLKNLTEKDILQLNNLLDKIRE